MRKLKIHADGDTHTRFVAEERIEREIENLSDLISSFVSDLPLEAINTLILNDIIRVEDLCKIFKSELADQIKRAGRRF